MNDLTTFSNPEFGQVRTVEINGTPWLVGKDVAIALGYKNPQRAIRDHVDTEDQGVTKTVTPSGEQEMLIINESGLYSLILSSKMPKAKAFKHWVTSEVLPSIRKHGAYMTPETLQAAILNPDTMIQLCQQLKAEQDKNAALTAANAALTPKGIFADAVSASKQSILVGDLAKMLKQNGVDIGATRLFQWMRENGYLVRGNRSDKNMPTQRSMEMGLFDIKETVVSHSDGHTTINKTPKVTGKGQVYFVNLFLKRRSAPAGRLKN